MQRIVYSTCSIHPVENEHVVRAALKLDEARKNHFVLAPRDTILPLWPRRGLESEMEDPGESDVTMRKLDIDFF